MTPLFFQKDFKVQNHSKITTTNTYTEQKELINLILASRISKKFIFDNGIFKNKIKSLMTRSLM